MIIGVSMAASGVTSFVFLLFALHDMAGIVVFPLRSVITVILVILMWITLWQERIRPLGWLGLATALMSIALIS